MNQEQLVYLKKYFHKASPIWSSRAREVPEGNNENTKNLIIHSKALRLLRNQAEETSNYLKHKMVAIRIWWQNLSFNPHVN